MILLTVGGRDFGRDFMWRWLFLLILLVAVPGCGPELSKTDLGHVVSEPPKAEDADKPYPMPQLGPPLKPEEIPHRGL
jgi:hypothetical protein